MIKSKEEVIVQFNKHVNMSTEELQEWLDNPKSEKAGTGVGIDSGHKIIEILKKNPDKDPEKYDEEDIGHMRKVVGYIGRHLAQEDHLKETKTREDLENTKSTISLKNWGHDPVKTLHDGTVADRETATEEPQHGKDKGGEPESPSKKPDLEESEKRTSTTANSGGAKRKFEDSQSKVEDADGEGERSKQPTNEDAGNKDSDEVDCRERARKKSKTTDAPEQLKAIEDADGN